MKVINFYEGPGSGKSTLDAELFVYMKKKCLNVEIATEYKTIVNSKSLNIEQRYAHVELYK